jgi:hypothetical protein
VTMTVILWHGNATGLELGYTATAVLSVLILLLLLVDTCLTVRDFARRQQNGKARARLIVELVLTLCALYFAGCFLLIGAVAVFRPQPAGTEPTTIGSLLVAFAFVSMNVILLAGVGWTWYRRSQQYGSIQGRWRTHAQRARRRTQKDEGGG